MKSSFLFSALLFGFFALIFLNVQRLRNTEVFSPISDSSGNILANFTKFPDSANIWFPTNGVYFSSISKPEILAKAGFVVDLTTGNVLYAKNEHEKLQIASTVKILTAGVALERKKAGEVFTVSETAAKIGEDFMGISAGEKLTLEELLYGLLLPSGNDASEAIAEGVAGSRGNFVKLMSEKAQLLGAFDSKFVNPSGLEDDGDHYSTAYDLALISRWVWTNFPLFRKIVGTKYYEIPYSAGEGSEGDSSPDHKYFYLENQTNLLRTYPGVKGIKPGYTPEAGLCLVTLAENGGHEVLGIVLGSEDRRGDMEKLLNYSFTILGVKI